MKIRKIMTFVLVVMMLLATVLPSIPGAAVTSGSLKFIDETRDQLDSSIQTARIIRASATGGVNWGAEPVSFTFYLNDYDGVTLSVDIADTSVAAVDLVTYRSSLDGTGDFYGLNGNILVLKPEKVGNTKVTVTAYKDGETAVCSFTLAVNLYEDTGEYVWSDMKVQGAGCVTGYIFHPYEAGILYASTDVGGAWRFDFEYDDQGKTIGGNWVEISKGLPSGAGQSRGIGVDPTPGRENWVYLAYGGNLLRSENRGDTWYIVSTATGVTMGGNSGNLRGLGGDNLVCIPNLKEGAPAGSENPDDYGDPTMYIMGATNYRISTDSGATWSGIQPEGLPPVNAAADGIFYDKTNSSFRVMNFANATAVNNGAYYSADGGVNWAALPGQPGVYEGARYYFPCKTTFTPPDAEGYRYIFVSYSVSHNTGAQVNDGQRGDGCVFRWKIDAAGVLQNNADGNTDGVNVTPQMIYGTPVHPQPANNTNDNRMAGVPISGLDAGPDGAIIVGTHNTDPYRLDTRTTNRGMETVFRSLDYGETWFPVLAGYDMFGYQVYGEKSGLASAAANGELNTNKWSAEVQAANPGTSTGTEAWWEPWTFLHWNFAPKINPHDADNMFIHSGMGSYVAYNLTALDEVGAAKAVPNARNARGLSVAEARIGLFSTTVDSGTDESSRTLGMTIADTRRTSDYNDFRIYSVNNSPGGLLTRADQVKWETAPGLYMTVWKSGMQSPASGRNILLATVCDYTPFRFETVGDNPWSAGGYGQWIDPVYNDLYDGSAGGQGTDWRIYTNDIDAKLLPAKPADDISNGGTKNYQIFASTSRGIHADLVDYPDANPDIVVSVTRMDWHFLSRGGATISFDGGRIFHNLPSNYSVIANSWEPHPSGALLGREATGIPSTIQTRINNFVVSSSTAGVQSGWVTINADASVVFWGVGANAQAQHVLRTKSVDGDPTTLGKAWIQPTFYAEAAPGTTEMRAANVVRIYADRVDPDVFYGFSNTVVGDTNFLVSLDGGLTFRPVPVSGGIPLTNVGSIDAYSGMARVVKGETGKFGTLWVDGNGLWKLVYDKETNTATATQVSGTEGFTLGNRSGTGLSTDSGANGVLYAVGTRTASTSLDSGTGIYRSLDNGQTWGKISPTATNGGETTTSADGSVSNPYRNDNWGFPDIRSVTGDPRVFGRVYVSTGNVSGGIRCGEIKVNLIESGMEPLEATMPVTTIVELLPATLPVYADAKFNGAEVTFEGTTAVIENGKAVLKIAAAPVAGNYKVTVAYGSQTKEIAIKVATSEGLWTPRFEGGNITFAAPVSLKADAKALLNGAQVDFRQIDPYILRADVSSALVEQSNKLVISGVKYPELFPSYKFTFTFNF